MIAEPIEVMEMIQGYSKIEEQYHDRISHVAFYSRGALTYDQTWMLSRAELENFEDIIKEHIKMASKMGMGGLF